MRVKTTLFASMYHAMPFSAHALKNIFFGIDILVKNKSKCGLAWSTLINNDTHHSQWSKFVVD